MMGLAASFIAKAAPSRHRWIAYIGLLIILYVALDMILSRRHGKSWPHVNDAIN